MPADSSTIAAQATFPSLPAFASLPAAGASGRAAASSGASDFFDIASKRLDYIDQRQRVLAQNIANANTPDYHPHDLTPFEKLLRQTPVTPVQTNPAHLGATMLSASLVTSIATERAIDGNTVNVENQLTKVADDETSASLVGNLWKTTMGMYLTALGRGG